MLRLCTGQVCQSVNYASHSPGSLKSRESMYNHQSFKSAFSGLNSNAHSSDWLDHKPNSFWLASILCLKTELLYQTPFISSSLPDSAEREIAFCPSIRLTSWSLGTQLEKSSLRLLTSSKPKLISVKRRKCQNCLCDSSFSYFISSTALVALFTPFIFSPWQHFFFGSVRCEHMAAPWCWPSSLAPWVALATAYLQGVARV